MIEEGFINEEISKTIIQNYLNNPTLQDINSLILACTHYPLIQKEIEEFYNNEINVIDSANIIAKHIKTKLNHLDLLSDTDNSENQFFVSNYTKSFEKSAKFFSQEEIKLTEINLHQ
jgi:glutamate racemase